MIIDITTSVSSIRQARFYFKFVRATFISAFILLVFGGISSIIPNVIFAKYNNVWVFFAIIENILYFLLLFLTIIVPFLLETWLLRREKKSVVFLTGSTAAAVVLVFFMNTVDLARLQYVGFGARPNFVTFEYISFLLVQFVAIAIIFRSLLLASKSISNPELRNFPPMLGLDNRYTSSFKWLTLQNIRFDAGVFKNSFSFVLWLCATILIGWSYIVIISLFVLTAYASSLLSHEYSYWENLYSVIGFAFVFILHCFLLRTSISIGNAVHIWAGNVASSPEPSAIVKGQGIGCLYLRPFRHDDGLARPMRKSFWRSFWRLDVNIGTIEELVYLKFRHSGRVIAIGDPESNGRVSGAERHYPDAGEDWHGVVAQLIEDASTIVLTVDESDGVIWEINECAKLKCIHKTIFIFPTLNIQNYWSDKFCDYISNFIGLDNLRGSIDTGRHMVLYECLDDNQGVLYVDQESTYDSVETAFFLASEKLVDVQYEARTAPVVQEAIHQLDTRINP